MIGYGVSWVTEVIVVFTWGLAPWFVYITMRESGRSKREAWTLFSFAAVWALFTWALVRTQMLPPANVLFQARPLVILTLAVIVALAVSRRVVGPGLNQRWLIGLQLFRAIGLVFVLEWSRGLLPPLFSHAAGWGDLAASLTALTVLVVYRRRAIPPAAVYTVAAVGLTDFASAFFFGFTSSETPVQLFAFDLPNRVIEYPTGLIPLFLVPFAVIFHILSIAEVRRQTRETQLSNQALPTGVGTPHTEPRRVVSFGGSR